MIELYGIRRSIDQKGIGMGFEVNEHRELIATFSTSENLNLYLGRRLLKNPIEQCGFEPGRRFRRDCDIGHFNDYDIVEIEAQIEVPHDPD